MLLMSGSLKDQPILSLHLGVPVGRAIEPIINPHNLKILGWWCQEKGARGRSILLAEEVRERLDRGLAVNDESAFAQPDELARHREILDIKFELIGKAVKTKRSKLGKVSDYAFDSEGLFVQKLYVARSFLKGLSKNALIIDRRQIIEITDDYILVRDTEVKATETEEELAPATEAVPAA